MMISRENYELWFLDYLEGNLEERMVDDFLEFLTENPDLAEELHLFEAIGLTESNLFFSDKKKLYKDTFDLPDVFDSTAIGLLEGDLDQDEVFRFNNYLKNHPEKNKEWQLFERTKLTPEPSLIFKNKQLLYRQPFIRRMVPGLMRIAAVFIFLFAFSRVMEKPSVEIIPGNPLTLYTWDYPATIKSGKIDRNITVSATERPLSVPDRSGNKEGIGKPKGKNPESPAFVALKSTIESSREYQPSVLASAYSSPVMEIQTLEPELMAPAFLYEIAAIDEPENVSLSRKFFQKIGLSGINTGKVVRWGLSLASGLTKEKFSYSTDASGEIIALNLDTRLVGLSIPVNRK